MEAVEGKVQRKVQDQNSEFEQKSEFQGQESAQLFADPNDGEQRKATQAGANNSAQVQQLMALQRAANQSGQVKQTAQLQAAAQQFSGKANGENPKKAAAKNGLPEQLKSGIESLSGFNMDDVRVHYNSSKPAEVGALAYALGNDIYLGAGQEAYLPHEAWHIVQQKQGRVKPTTQAENGAAINDNPSLEQEADRMGAKAMQILGSDKSKPLQDAPLSSGSIQMKPTSIVDPTVNSKGLYFDKRDHATVIGKSVPQHVIGVVKKGKGGSKPSVTTPGWDWLQNHVERMKGSWVRFHLINEHLGGPGNQAFNLVPTSVAVNNAYERSIETHAKAAAKNEWTYIEVKMDYDKYPNIPVPQSITAEYGTWDSEESKWVKAKEDTFTNPDLGEIASGFTYKRGVGITNSQLEARNVPTRYRRDYKDWLQDYRQDSDSDGQFARAAEDQFGPDVYDGWLDQIWLDEAVDNEDEYQPVLKALPNKKKRKRTVSLSENPGAKKKKKIE